MYAAWRERRVRFTTQKAGYAMISGVLVFLVVNFLIVAIERGEVSIVVPIANLSFIVALLVSIGLKWEPPSSPKALAVALAAVLNAI